MAEHSPLDPQSPWPGLASFAEGDQAYFRGREREADELLRMVRRERLTVLFGRSGLGKTSLLRAGLFPRLREGLYLPVALRIDYAAPTSPRQQVWDALADACAADGVQSAPPEPGESLWAYFHRSGAGFWNRRRRPVLPVLVFDQFEEVFTLGQINPAVRAVAAAFIEELADLVEDRPPQAAGLQPDADAGLERIDFERRGCKVMLSFREDFLPEFEALRARMPSVMRNRFRLLPMNVTQARAVIASGGALVGSDVGERIIGLAWRNSTELPTPEETERIEVDPALLSVISSELNLRRRAANAATIEIGLLDGAGREVLANFYERSFQGLNPRVRQFVEDELITAAGYRDSFAIDDAAALEGVSAEALQQLVDGRLLRLDERFGARRLELTHDVLARIVKDSRDQRRERVALETAKRERAEAQRQAQEAKWRLRKSRSLAVGMATLAMAALGLFAIFFDDWSWARENGLPADSLVTLQRFRLGYAPLPTLKKIEPGKFQMGESDLEFRQWRREEFGVGDAARFGAPLTEVRIDQPFWIGETEVTYDQYDYFLWSGGGSTEVRRSPPGAARGDRPVVHLTHDEASAYADWLGPKIGQHCRLPTEAEWEYAARAGTRSAYWWGDLAMPSNASSCYEKVCVDSQSRPVRSFEPNKWGLYDTAGNVWEMTCSGWQDEFTGEERKCVDGDPPPKGYATRGGSWRERAVLARSSARSPAQRKHTSVVIGFRISCSDPVPSPAQSR